MIYCEDRASELLETHLTHQGFLRVESVIGRPGVLTYTQSDGSIRRELRPPEELKKAISLDSAVGIPVTNGHPVRTEIPLNPINIKQYEVGHTGDKVLFDNDKIKTTVTVKENKALQDIGKGKVQLSPAYFKELDFTSGVWTNPKGEKQEYDAIQRKIRYDHVAIVKAGRAGSSVALGLSTDGIDIDPGSVPEGGTMPVQLSLDDGVQVPITDPGVAGLITTAMQKKEERIVELEKEKKEMQASLDAKEIELTKAKETVKTKVDPEIVRQRLSLERMAKEMLGDKISLDEMEDLEIKKAVIISTYPTLKERLEAETEAYVNASFDMACVYYQDLKKEEDKKKAAKPRIVDSLRVSADEKDKPKLSAREKFILKQKDNRSKTPIEIAKEQ